jgi:Protein of unknown function (DUF2569)
LEPSCSWSCCWGLLAAVLVSFARKQKTFVRLTMLWMLSCILVAIVDHHLCAVIPVLEEDGTLNVTAHEILRSDAFALVWTPYLMFSRRLPQTFVN